MRSINLVKIIGNFNSAALVIALLSLGGITAGCGSDSSSTSVETDSGAKADASSDKDAANAADAAADVVDEGDTDASSDAEAGSDAGCKATGVDPAFAKTLQDTLDKKSAAMGAPGVTAAVWLPCEGLWTGASGVADVKTNKAVEASDLFRIASLTKMYVAATTMLYVQKGSVALDDPMDKFLKTVPFAGNGITVRQLLSHRACVPDYTDEQAFLSDSSDPNRVFTPDELLGYVKGHDLLCTPGSEYHYSNTGYILLGLLLEKIAAVPLDQSVTASVLAPYHLDHTTFPHGETAPAFVTGYAKKAGGSPPFVPSAVSLSSAWAAGNMVANAGDVATWGHLLYGRKVLEQSSLAEMVGCKSTGAEGEGYGLGTLCIDTPVGKLVGHGGGTWGFTAGMFYMNSGASIAVLTNLEDAQLDDLLSSLVMNVFTH